MASPAKSKTPRKPRIPSEGPLIRQAFLDEIEPEGLADVCRQRYQEGLDLGQTPDEAWAVAKAYIEQRRRVPDAQGGGKEASGGPAKGSNGLTGLAWVADALGRDDVDEESLKAECPDNATWGQYKWGKGSPDKFYVHYQREKAKEVQADAGLGVSDTVVNNLLRYEAWALEAEREAARRASEGVKK